MKTSFYAALMGAALLGSLAFLPSSVQAKTLRECNAEWTANKATIQASGKTRRAFVAECRGGSQDATAVKPPRKTARLGRSQFATEAEAKTSCPTDIVVWVNLRSKVYHTHDSASFGRTKRGAYMCERDTAAAGYRAPKAKRAGAQ